jgi:glycosyltransferase involved in cell wall biosynthesis
MNLGIDASNLRGGGGVTHLVEFLGAANPLAHGFERVFVWGPQATLAQLPSRPWLHREHVPMLDRALPYRLFWQRRHSGPTAQRNCDILFVPGGSYSGTFHPFVTMFRNTLPFSDIERHRYGVSWRAAKLALLKLGQTATFRAADGIIFLNQHACEVLQAVTGPLAGAVTTIPHGVDPSFHRRPNTDRAGSGFSVDRPFKFLYVSTVDIYKHQEVVAEAVVDLAGRGIPVTLDLIGSAYAPALRRLERTLAKIDPDGRVVRYHGEVAYPKLPQWYHATDAFVFASTCENMPNILLEAMAAALPIACSNRRPMPDVLGDGGVYFDPESVPSVSEALSRLMNDPALRDQLAERAHNRSSEFTWRESADRTLAFIHDVKTASSPSASMTLPKVSVAARGFQDL